jgi:hypothetical protein
LLSKTDSPVVIDKNGYLVLPNSASIKDAKKEVSFYSSSSKTDKTSSNANLDKNIIGKISYTYQNKYVGGADILYNKAKSIDLIPSALKSKGSTSTKETSEKPNGHLRMIVIIVIIGLIVTAGAIYFIVIELPRLNRRSAYYRKRKHRMFHKNDDFLDL